MKILLSKSQWELIGKQAGWGKSNDASASQLSQIKHRISGYIYQLTTKHGYTRDELIKYLRDHGLCNGDFSVNSINPEQAKGMVEVLEILYKDMERLDKDFGVGNEDYSSLNNSLSPA